MFTYTNNRYNPPECATTARGAFRPQVTSPSSAVRDALMHARTKAQSTTTIPKPVQRPGREKISERYINPAYNRQPSPLPRVHSPARGTSRSLVPKSEGVRESSRVSPRPLTRQASVTVTHSVTSKRRLETQCQQGSSKSLSSDPLRTRPKTADDRRSDVKVSPSLEDIVFHAVKDVISRAVLEKGKIDQNNINAIFNEMKRRLLGEENVDDDAVEDVSVDIDVNLKQSKTSLNVQPPTRSKTVSIVKSKPATGIVRKNVAETPKRGQSTYRRVYSKDVSKSPKLERNEDFFNNDRDKVVYVELPDPDYSNFNAIVKKEEERRLSQRKVNEEPQNVEPSDSQVEEEFVQSVSRQESLADSTNQSVRDGNTAAEKIGDGQPFSEYKPCDLYKTVEDVKLQTYIEALVRNMNEQLRSKQVNGAISNQMETEQAICKSFCVCRVCVSKKAMSNKSLIGDPSNNKIGQSNQAEAPLRNSNVKNIHLSSNASKPMKETKVIRKQLSKEPNCKVLQRNTNFQPESKLDLMSRVRGPPRVTSKLSTTSKTFRDAVDDTEKEASEDSYLKRRMKKSAVVKRPNTAKT